MIISEQLQKALTYISEIEVSSDLTPQETGRAFYEKFAPLAGEKEPVFLIKNHLLVNGEQKISIRVYKPVDQKDLSIMVYFHGGWFNAGSLETHDTPLRQLCNLTQTIIVSVNYRLAPEFPFPAGLNDCQFAVQWLIENGTSLGGNTNKIIIAGDSAGGALAATITRKFRDKVSAQLLIYPVTDHTLSSDSWAEFQNGPLLNSEGGIQAWNWYLSKKEDRNNPDAIPLLSNDLKNIPPTFIAVSEYDPLRDEAIQYAEKLKTQGVHVRLNLYKGTTHGFFQMGGYVDATETLMRDMNNYIQCFNSEKNINI